MTTNLHTEIPFLGSADLDHLESKLKTTLHFYIVACWGIALLVLVAAFLFGLNPFIGMAVAMLILLQPTPFTHNGKHYDRLANDPIYLEGELGWYQNYTTIVDPQRRARARKHSHRARWRCWLDCKLLELEVAR